MKLSVQGRLRQAIRVAFVAGVASNSYVVSADDTPAPTSSPSPQQLQRVEVTGSRIRRVDTETASPLYTIDRAYIDKSGVQTVGQLIQELPSIAGNSTNTQVNQGATGFATSGAGAATISLRGLGDVRTLVLLDGHRFVGSGPNSTNDVNALPINVVERIEVLKEGASAVYGSDAVGGVVNIITRKNFKGAEFSASLGTSKQSDGGRQDYSFAFGANGEKSHLIVGLNYNKQDAISAADRNFAKNALYLYSGVVSAAGSSRNPNGRIYLPVGSPGAAPFSSCTPSSGLVSITRNAGATGAAPGDYHCYSSADSFNYQAVGNVVLTPQERYGLFTSGNYDLTDHVQFYTELFHNVTNSNSAIAPLPFDARSDDVSVSANALGNIFGTGFGGADAVNPNLLSRFVASGNRTFKFETIVDQINVGTRGELFGWNWDAGIGYGRVDQTEHGINYIGTAKLKNAVGPSFIAQDGTPTCGTPDNPISGCIPLNIFNIPGSPAGALEALTANFSNSQITQLKTGAINVNGDVVPLPAGMLSLAAGIEYRKYELNSNVDAATTLQAPNFLNCDLPQEVCTSATRGEYDSTEYYAEALIPVLKDLPGAKVLNLIAGTRYSDYSNFGGTLNSKIAMEWRPVGDVLTRVSFSQVFRAPTITDLYSGPVVGNPNFRDPCAKTSTPVGANPNFDLTCENVPRDGSFAEPTSQVTGQQTGNSSLKPERGHVLTFGAVYDPNFLPGFSTSIDFWKYSLTDLIVYPDVNAIAQGCLATGSAQFCNLIHRNASDGTVSFISQPNSNLGKLNVQGVDLGFKYILPQIVPGKVRISLDATFLDKYDNTPIPSAPGYINHIAGTYSRQFGEFSRWRGIGTIGWDYAGFDTLWTVRFLGPFDLPNPDGSPSVLSSPTLHYKSTIYDNVEVGYTFAKTNTRVGFGVDNVFNQPPPILYQNNVLNANTDVNTFDTVGTYFWLRFTQRFK